MDNYNKVVKLHNMLSEIGLTKDEIDNRIFSIDVLVEIMNAIDQVGEIGWDFLRNFPADGNFYLLNNPILDDIYDKYNKMPSADIHSGASIACLMRLVQSIAKNGFDEFTNKVCKNILAERQNNK
jgi:hypothetical protein